MASSVVDTAYAVEDNGQLHLTFRWCGMCGDYLCYAYGDLIDATAKVEGTWATVSGVEFLCGFQVYLDLAPGASGGDLTLKGSLRGLDSCEEQLICPVEILYHVQRADDAGSWLITREP